MGWSAAEAARSDSHVSEDGAGRLRRFVPQAGGEIRRGEPACRVRHVVSCVPRSPMRSVANHGGHPTEESQSRSPLHSEAVLSAG
jgi:hypothetical protein